MEMKFAGMTLKPTARGVQRNDIIGTNASHSSIGLAALKHARGNYIHFGPKGFLRHSVRALPLLLYKFFLGHTLQILRCLPG